MLSCNYDLAHRQGADFFWYLELMPWISEINFELSLSITPPRVSCVLFCHGAVNKYEVLFNSGKQLLKHTKCLKLFVVMNLYLVCMRENGLKNIETDVRTLKLSDSG